MTNNDRKKIGRPRLGAEKRRFRIAASFTLEERKRIEEIAKSLKISPSDFLYRAALSREVAAPPPAVNLSALKEINAIGKNLNLLARAVYSGCKIDLRAVDKYFAILSALKAEIMESKS